MARILYISDFASEGSGYEKISIALCSGLADYGHDIKAVGLNYKGKEHTFPFNIIPCAAFNEIHAMLHNFATSSEWKPQIVIIAFDLPQHHMFIDKVTSYSLPYIGITPLENPPLTMSWAAPLLNADVMYFISQMGTDAARKAGVSTAEFIQIGIDPMWTMPKEDEREKMRKNMGVDDKFVILSVADNQERKNLWAGLEIIARLKREGINNLKYFLVTREHLTFGWRLRDLAQELNINEELSIVERGVPLKTLRTYYAIADIFLNTSKAEGLGMPLLEAMACGTPVLVTHTGAMPELLENDRGRTIPVEYSFRDVWGNAKRDMVNIEAGVRILREMMEEDLHEVTNRAKDYAMSRTWDIPVNQLHNKIEEILNGKAEKN